MRIAKILLLIVVVITIGYYLLWNSHAEKSKETLIAKINAFNKEQIKQSASEEGEKTKADEAVLLIEYDKVEKSGFPFYINLDIINPKATLTIGEYEEISSLKGKLTISSNYIKRSLSLAIQGNMETAHSVKKNILHRTNIDTTSSPQICTVIFSENMKWSIVTESIFEHFSSPQDVIRNIEELKCAANGNRVTDADSGETLVSYDDLLLYYLAKTEDGINYNAKLKIVAKNLDISDKFGEMYKEATKAYLDSKISQSDDSSTVEHLKTIESIVYDISGKSNTIIDLSYQGPIERNKSTKGQDVIKLIANSLIINNKYMDIDLPFSLSIDRSSKNSATVKLKTSGNIEFTEEYEKLLKYSLGGMAKEMYNIIRNDSHSSTKDKNALIVFIKSFKSADEAVAYFESIVPDFSSIGKINIKIDANNIKKIDKYGFDSKNILKVKLFSIENNDYGIRLSGDIGLRNIIKTDFTLSCYKCDALVNDIMKYAAKFESIAIKTKNRPVARITTDENIKKIQAFLYQISKPENHGAILVFDVKDNGKGMLAVNSTPLHQLVTIGLQIFMPELDINRARKIE